MSDVRYEYLTVAAEKDGDSTNEFYWSLVKLWILLKSGVLEGEDQGGKLKAYMQFERTKPWSVTKDRLDELPDGVFKSGNEPFLAFLACQLRFRAAELRPRLVYYVGDTRQTLQLSGSTCAELRKEENVRSGFEQLAADLDKQTAAYCKRAGTQ